MTHERVVSPQPSKPQPAQEPVQKPCAHHMRKVEGVWTCCVCGDRRDKHGKPIQPRHLRVVK